MPFLLACSCWLTTNYRTTWQSLFLIYFWIWFLIFFYQAHILVPFYDPFPDIIYYLLLGLRLRCPLPFGSSEHLQQFLVLVVLTQRGYCMSCNRILKLNTCFLTRLITSWNNTFWWVVKPNIFYDWTNETCVVDHCPAWNFAT